MPTSPPAPWRQRSCAVISLVFVFSGCAAISGDDDVDFDEDLADQLATRWQLPADLVSIANAQTVGYDGAEAFNGGRGCTGTFTGGAMVLKEFVNDLDGVTSVSGYSCRANTAQTSQTSIHGTGRALDIFIPLDGKTANNRLGDPVANWLVENAESIGVQLVIWDRSQYNPSNKTKFRSYGGPHPHHDHIHVELTLAAAAQMTPWFNGGGPAPSGDPWVGTPCTEHDTCDFDSNGTLGECTAWHDAEVDDLFGYCTLSCEGFCPDKSGHASTFCVDNGLGFGHCVATASAQNDDCSLIRGTEPRVMERFIGSSGASPSVQTVCLAPDRNGPSCSVNSGECIDVDLMTCHTGTLSGQCPGGSNIRCCPN